MRLSELFRVSEVVPSSLSEDVEFVGINSDTRSLKPGEIFVCMPSPSGDTHRFAEQAVSSGAAALIAHTIEGYSHASKYGPTALLANDGNLFNEAIGKLCRVAFNDPTRSMRVFGVTGTNGKTTVAWLLRESLTAMGRKAAYLGTLGVGTIEGERFFGNTTPFPVELNRILAELRDDGVSDLAMEVSSHALDQRRCESVRFDVGVFTNLTQDHLDYHQTMEAYADAKLRLFTELGPNGGKAFRSAINVSDTYGQLWASGRLNDALTFGHGSAELANGTPDVRFDSLTVPVQYKGESALLRMKLGGHYNVENSLSALAALLCAGIPLSNAVEALRHARPVLGRFEPVPNDIGLEVIIDYAHTPDALMKLTAAARALKPNRIITVFGCGGDRDRGKRPLMARAVSQGSDITVLTSDNPRTEDPEQILKDAEAGLIPGSESVSIIDRQEAVTYAISRARPGDIVIIAGKGHENYQIIGTEKFHMDDRELVQNAIAAREVTR